MERTNKMISLIITIVFIVSLFIGVILLTYSKYLKNNNIYEEENNNKPTIISKDISMNLEQTAGAGDYKTVTQSNWPTEGYKFNRELSRCENGSTVSWDDTKKVIVVSGNLSDKCYVYFDIISSIAAYCTSGTDLATCVKNFGDQGVEVSNIYIHDSSLTNGAGDNSYRYAGASEKVNNYVCFGSTENPCLEDNLYRIIGVIDNKVKLIKAKNANSNLLGTDGTYSSDNLYQWSELYSCPSTIAYSDLQTDNLMFLSNRNELAAGAMVQGCNDWNQSTLNTVNLNNNFKNSLGTYNNLIEPTTFSINSNSYTSEIALINKSDYNFAFSKEYWNIYSWLTETTSDTSYKNNNWMYQEDGTCRWTIEYERRGSGNTDTTIGIIAYDGMYESVSSLQYNGGSVITESTSSTCAVYPTFFFKQSVTYVSGTGTQSDPIRIN